MVKKAEPQKKTTSNKVEVKEVKAKVAEVKDVKKAVKVVDKLVKSITPKATVAKKPVAKKEAAPVKKFKGPTSKELIAQMQEITSKTFR